MSVTWHDATVHLHHDAQFWYSSFPQFVLVRERARASGVQMKNDHQHFAALFSLESLCMIYIRCAQTYSINSSWPFYRNLPRALHFATPDHRRRYLLLRCSLSFTPVTVHSVVALCVHNQKQSKVDQFLDRMDECSGTCSKWTIQSKATTIKLHSKWSNWTEMRLL